MKLIFNVTKKRYESISTIQEKDIPKNAGFRWDPSNVVWFTDSATSAAKLKTYADAGALAELQKGIEITKAALEASHANDADISIPAPTGFEYLPFQKAGIAYALGRKSTLIADEMGLGKTIQALGLINADPSIKKALVIAPAGLRLNWVKEAGKWLVQSLPILRAGKNGIPAFTEGLLILGYEEATKYAPVLGGMGWDLIVADEAHYLKNPKAKRTKAILKLNASRWVMLTGTPILNRPVELFPLLQKVDPTDLGADFFRYAFRYCDAERNDWGKWDFTGASNLEELNLKLRTGGMIRRLKSNVLTALPPKRHALLPLEPSAAAKKLIAEEKKRALESLKAARKAKHLQGKDPVAFADDIKKLRDTGAVEFTEIARIRHELALLKVDQVVAHVAGVLESEPIIVFAHHQDVAKAIANGLSDFKVALITGKESKEIQNAAVEAFQEGKIDCVVCSLKAAGVGVTLTRSSHVVIAELDWSPGGMDQAEDRAHRIGQNESVLIEWLVLDGSMEVKMAKTLSSKKKVVNTALGDKTTAETTLKIAGLEEITDEDFAAAGVRAEEAEKAAVEKKVLAEAAELEATRREFLKAHIAKYGFTGRFAVRIRGAVVTGILKLGGGYRPHFWPDLEAQLDFIKAVEVDEEAARILYGKQTGICAYCASPLSDPVSRHLGVGPTCGAPLHTRYKQLAAIAEDFADLFQEAA